MDVIGGVIERVTFKNQKFKISYENIFYQN